MPTKNRPFDGKAFARSAGASPGVYQMINAEGKTLYVGKAKHLKNRISSYFNRADRGSRIALMLSHVAGMEVSLTRTEAEALILENRLIKSLKPRYNVLFRDDKSYPYIRVSTDKAFPGLSFHRGSRAGPGKFFGPFPSAGAVRESLGILQKLFQIRQCEESYFKNRSRPCLQHQIQRCSAPCVGYISAPDYGREVEKATLFLKGKSETVITQLVAEMERCSVQLEFEDAARIRDQIANLKKVQQQQFVTGLNGDIDVLACAQEGVTCSVHVIHIRAGRNTGHRNHRTKVPIASDEGAILSAFLLQHYASSNPPGTFLVSQFGDDRELVEKALGEVHKKKISIVAHPRGKRRKLVEQALRNARHDLNLATAEGQTALRKMTLLSEFLRVDELLQKIECFDISHTQGERAVASCVVFDQSGARKDQYRRFNIQGIVGGDDYAAMQQAVKRRYQRQLKYSAKLPDLIMIDGGKGQLGVVEEVLKELGLADIALVGISKGPERRAGEEDIILGYSHLKLFPGSDSGVSHLLQQIRDEAHRFAIAGHRGQRAKARTTSRLEHIPGIGAGRRKNLLQHFGGIQGVLAAGAEELATVPGISASLASAVYADLHPG